MLLLTQSVGDITVAFVDFIAIVVVVVGYIFNFRLHIQKQIDLILVFLYFYWINVFFSFKFIIESGCIEKKQTASTFISMYMPVLL